MTAEQRSALLRYCTGSSRAPAGGFAAMMGFNEAQQRFTLARAEGGPDRLPTASTCFNTLRLPAYPSQGVLEARLRTALSAPLSFYEGATVGP